MRFICLSYIGPMSWETMSEADRNASMAEFFEYDEMLRKNGHIVGGEGLRSAETAATLRFKQGKVFVTDGPFAETKEQLAGFFVIEARDMEQAIELMSNHPVVRGGPVEIRAAADPMEMERAREAWLASREAGS